MRHCCRMLAVVALVGCGRTPEQTGTGAREAAQAYYDALIRQDWPQAYAVLQSESKKQCSQEQFTRLAKQYRANLGFEPTTVHIRACEENGSDAIAHVTIGGPKQFRDAVSVRKDGDAWRILLSSKFGRK